MARAFGPGRLHSSCRGRFQSNSMSAFVYLFVQAIEMRIRSGASCRTPNDLSGLTALLAKEFVEMLYQGAGEFRIFQIAVDFFDFEGDPGFEEAL